MRIFPRVNKSMCGCSLETGTAIIGWISLAVYTLLFFFYMKFFFNSKGLLENPEYRGILIHMLVRTVILIIYIISDVLLIIGAYRKHPPFLLIWMIVKGLSLIIYLIYNIIVLIERFEYHIMIRWVLSLAIGYYCLIIVNGYYEDLKSSRAESSRTSNDNQMKNFQHQMQLPREDTVEHL